MGADEIMMKDKDAEIRKFLQEKFDPQSQFDKLKTYKNAANQPLFHEDFHEQYKVNILPDASIGPAKFIPDPLRPNVFRANPVTIRAMRKDLFMGGAGFEDLEVLYVCASCKHEIDLQFWQFCPYCEAPIKLESK